METVAAAPTEFRIAKRLDCRTGHWIAVLFEQIQKGDIFQLWEATGEPVRGKDGGLLFLALNNPVHSAENGWFLKTENLVGAGAE